MTLSWTVLRVSSSVRSPIDKLFPQKLLQPHRMFGQANSPIALHVIVDSASEAVFSCSGAALVRVPARGGFRYHAKRHITPGVLIPVRFGPKR